MKKIILTENINKEVVDTKIEKFNPKDKRISLNLPSEE